MRSYFLIRFNGQKVTGRSYKYNTHKAIFKDAYKMRGEQKLERRTKSKSTSIMSSCHVKEYVVFVRDWRRWFFYDFKKGKRGMG